MTERFLVSADLGKIPEIWSPVLVVGSGIAGLSAALEAAKTSRVALVCKEELAESATFYAQGGIAAALSKDDSFACHIEDTKVAGQGLCDEDALRILVEDGAAFTQELIDQGAAFDRDGDELHFTMEGAHTARRILHGEGDATGKMLQNFLINKVRENSNITVYENHFCIDLLHDNNECYGALLLDNIYGKQLAVRSGAVILATGGGGQIFRETTNPACATGDGFALAFRAGATLRDMEFIQFHPTTLYLAGAPRFLISESVRGEGARLINSAGEDFMSRYDERGCLAPRDIVSQSIFRELHRSAGATAVYLDLRHLDKEMVLKRFPNINRICSMYGIDITSDLIPVRPAVHYFMGGIKTDLFGQTNVKFLFAAGECASVGVHGANRLASNSLLEGLVFGRRAGSKACACPEPHYKEIKMTRSVTTGTTLDLDDMGRSLKSLSWRDLGVFRSEEKLQGALKSIKQWERYVLGEEFNNKRGFEMQNMLSIAKVIALCALKREESRGAHQRTDFPTQAPGQFHTEINIYDI